MNRSEPKINRGIAPQMLKSSFFWTLIRGSFLAAMVWTISVSWGRWNIPDLEAVDPLMYTNLGNTLFWVVWMMGLVVIAPAAGRVWCAVCPLGALNEIVSRWGMAKPFPGIFRNDYVKASFLLFTLVLLGLLQIHHYPGATALFLAGWGMVALIAGLLFTGRSLCSYLCPVGGMLNLYSRTSPMGITVRDQEKCEECENRECVKGRERWVQMAFLRLRSAVRFRDYPCPVNLKVWDMKGSGRCLLCLNCMRACPYDNVQISARAPFAPLWSERYPRFSEVAMTAVIIGFLLLSYSRFWPGLESVLAYPISPLTGFVGPSASRVTYIIWVGFLLPMILMVAPSVAVIGSGLFSAPASRTGIESAGKDGVFPVKFWLAPSSRGNPRVNDEDGERVITRTGTVGGLAAVCLPSLIPLLLAAHIVLAVVKINAKAGYLALGLADPTGIQSYLAVEELGLYPKPGLLVSLETVKGLAVFLMAGGFLLSFLTVMKITKREGVPFVPFALQVAVAGVCFTGGLVKWLF